MVREPLLGWVFSLMSAVAYGAVSVVAMFGIKKLAPPLVGATIALICGTLIIAIASGREFGTSLRRRGKAVHLLFVAGLLAALAQIAWYLALSKATVVVVASLVGTYPLVTIVISCLFLQRLERVSLPLVLGGIFIVLGGAIIALT